VFRRRPNNPVGAECFRLPDLRRLRMRPREILIVDEPNGAFYSGPARFALVEGIRSSLVVHSTMSKEVAFARWSAGLPDRHPGA